MDSVNPDHPTRHIKWGDMAADVDVELADFVLALWQLEIRTDGSCQDPDGDGSKRQVVFTCLDDVFRFISAAGPYDDISVTWHVRGEFSPEVEFPADDTNHLLERIQIAQTAHEQA